MIVQLSFVCGIATSLQISVDRDPREFRSRQREIVRHLPAGTWTACLPELYADRPTDSRPPSQDVALLRTWTTEAVGTTRLPVGLVRFVSVESDQSSATDSRQAPWKPSRRDVTIWPDRAGVACLHYTLEVADLAEIPELRVRADERWDEMTAGAVAAADEALGALVPALAATGIETISPTEPSSRYVGRHRLWRLETDPDAPTIERARALALIGSEDHYRDVCAEPDWFACPGNGMSLEIGRRRDRDFSVLDPVLRYYEYWVTAVATADDNLHSEYTALSGSHRDVAPNDRMDPDDVRQLFFAHRDVLAAMSPPHRAAWDGYLCMWGLSDLEVDVQEKVRAVDEVRRQNREERANAIAYRTNLVVTFLTALTLISIATGIAVFMIAERDLAYPLRIGTVVVSTLSATALFVMSIRPALKAAPLRGSSAAGWSQRPE